MRAELLCKLFLAVLRLASTQECYR